MMAWLLVAGVVLSTVAADVLQASEMKRHGEIADFHPGRLGRVWLAMFQRRYLLASIVFMATSFFCFLKLLEVADLSFAVPATALSLVLETFMARYVLKESVGPARWAGASLVAAGVWLLAL
ncbi:MAG: DMT family transporter [Bryobacteraceae bacterium]|nr:DMT family transporter [Bryobacteraceae bacterium]